MAQAAVVDKAKAISDVKTRGLTLREAAKLQGCSHQAIHKIISNLTPQDAIKPYLDGRATAMAERGAILLSMVDTDLAKRLWEKNPAVATLLLNSLYNNERLERGQATSIVDIREYQVKIEAITARLNGKDTAIESKEDVVDVPCLSADKKSVEKSSG